MVANSPYCQRAAEHRSRCYDSPRPPNLEEARQRDMLQPPPPSLQTSPVPVSLPLSLCNDSRVSFLIVFIFYIYTLQNLYREHTPCPTEPKPRPVLFPPLAFRRGQVRRKAMKTNHTLSIPIPISKTAGSSQERPTTDSTLAGHEKTAEKMSAFSKSTVSRPSLPLPSSPPPSLPSPPLLAPPPPSLLARNPPHFHSRTPPPRKRTGAKPMPSQRHRHVPYSTYHPEKSLGPSRAWSFRAALRMPASRLKSNSLIIAPTFLSRKLL